MAQYRPKLEAWASARSQPEGLLANPDVLDQVVIWRMNDPRFTDRENIVKGMAMQRQWTIEARADFADQEKNDAITEAVRVAAVHINATLQLLSDGQKPQVVAFSDDFFAGHAEIALLEDKLGAAKLDMAGKLGADEQVSDELLDAVREIEQPKGK